MTNNNVDKMLVTAKKSKHFTQIKGMNKATLIVNAVDCYEHIEHLTNKLRMEEERSRNAYKLVDDTSAMGLQEDKVLKKTISLMDEKLIDLTEQLQTQKKHTIAFRDWASEQSENVSKLLLLLMQEKRS